jgi:hypothetical protein
MENPIIIQTALPGQYLNSLAFVQEIYKKRLGTYPAHIWPDYLIATRDEETVGIIAMQYSEGEKFEIEKQFVFDFSLLSRSRKEFVSFGRWTAAERGIGSVLVFAATVFALKKNRLYGLSCSKPNGLKLLRRVYGLEFDVYSVPVNLRQISEGDKSFFLNSPKPQLCVASLQQWYDKLVRSVPKSFKILF